MEDGERETKGAFLTIQNRQADPKGLGLSQSPAFYFERRRREERKPLEELQVAQTLVLRLAEEGREAISAEVLHLENLRKERERQTELLRAVEAECRRQIAGCQEREKRLKAREEQERKDRYEQILKLKQDLAITKESVKEVQAEVQREESLLLEKTIFLHSQQVVYDQKVTEQAQLQAQASALSLNLAQLNTSLSDLTDISQAYRETIDFYNAQRLQTHATLKQLNNRLQELKGNIRVFCRIRPLLLEDKSTSSILSVSGNSVQISEKPGKAKSFRFDRVFSEESTQETVFEEISQLVQSAVDGYKVSIFAYGETGSGKTYTMEGPEDLRDVGKKGVIQRSVEQIFGATENLRKFGWVYRLQASFVEVYNEQIRDLLEGSKVMTAFSASLIEPTSVEVLNPQTLYDLLSRARQQRANAQTLYNGHSSRSHSLFQLKITGFNAVAMKESYGVLNLIDLAGSERWDEAQGDEERKAETKAINKSLSALRDVIQALANKDQHIPFRNSKLTFLLQNCLGAESKTLMFLNLNPAATRTNETICSLRFASKVSTCNLGQPKKHISQLLNSRN